MPIVINEIVSDIRISAPSGNAPSGSVKDSNSERNNADRLLDALLREKSRLTGRDQDDKQGAYR